jgi:hypothetical protein
MLFRCADFHAANFVNCSIASRSDRADTPIRRYINTTAMWFPLAVPVPKPPGQYAEAPAAPAKAPRRGIKSYVQLIAALAFVLPAGVCLSYPRIPATGRLANISISTTVDSELAKYYLAISSGQSAGNSSLAKRITEIEQSFAKRPLDEATLKAISEETSPDFATVYFVNRCLANHTNASFQAGYSNEAQRVKSLIQQGKWNQAVRTSLRKYKLLFIPGFHYLTDPTSGADFASQRQMMHELGLHVGLAATEEDGTIEENAEIIARIVRLESRYNSNLILVSTSKAGPETALALGKILGPAETTSVKAWLSVGGLIQGTYLADRVISWPKSWIARFIFWLEHTDFRSVLGLTTEASRARWSETKLPRNILIVQYVAVPLSGNIARGVKVRYNYLRKFGPNDGLTLLADELMPRGITILEPGFDHFYRDPDINLQSLAIANLVAEKLNVRSSRRK